VSEPPDADVGQVLLARKLKQRMTLADFNNDGRADIAIGDFVADRVLMFEGTPDGSFRRWPLLATDRGPRALVSGDLNLDGIIDLAIAHFFSGTVTIHHGRGDGRFASQQSIRLAAGLSSMVSQDLDRDGLIDLAVANALSGKLALLTSTGNGRFQIQHADAALPEAAFLMSSGKDDAATRDLIAMDPSGASVRRFRRPAFVALVDGGAVDVESMEVASLPTVDSYSSTVLRTLRIVAGDGQATIAGHSAPCTFGVQLSSPDGLPVGGAEVQFLNLLDKAAVDLPRRVTDEGGHATLVLPVHDGPGMRAVATSTDSGEIAVVTALAALSPSQLADRIEIALGRSADRSPRKRALQQAITRGRESLRAGRTTAALRTLSGADTVGVAGSGTDRLHDPGSDEAGALVRVLVDQLLLLGASPAEAAAIACDRGVSGSIDAPSETDVHSFSVADGERVQITVVERMPAGVNFAPSWRLITAAGSPASLCGSFTTGPQRDCGPLTAAGNPYRIEIIDHLRDDTGPYAVHVFKLRAATACDVVRVGCDAPLVGMIESPLDSDLVEIGSMADGEYLQVTVSRRTPSGPNFAPMWRLLNAAGTPAAACGGFTTGPQRDCGPLSVGGNPYQIQVMDHARDDSGNYAVHVFKLRAATACDVATIRCNTPITGTIESALDSDLMRMDPIAEGEYVQITVARQLPSGANFTPRWRLLKGAGTPAPLCGGFTTSPQRDCGPLPAAGNPYLIQILDQGSDDSGRYAVHVFKLRAATACGTVNISCDTPITGNVASALDTDLIRVGPVTDGEYLQITVPKRSPSGSNFHPSWR
jgi:hypothetical protein